MSTLLNTVLAKSNVQALILGRDMQLPPHVQMPKVTKAK